LGSEDLLKEKSSSFQEIEELKNLEISEKVIDRSKEVEKKEENKMIQTTIDDWLDDVLFD
jgi:hypothetical protein